MEIGYLTALLGGALALLSPCGALLLPAFFAGTVGSGPRLLAHGGVFYLGLAVTLVPLGLGAALLGAALTQHRDLLVTTAGWLIIVFGLLQVMGLGFDLRRLLPGADRLAASQGRRQGMPRTFVLGTLSGVAGFCAGPILGAVLTLAAAQGSAVLGGTMLAVYAAGMVLPLLAIAWLWARSGATVGRTWLRGRELRLGRLRLHTTSVVTGGLLVTVGIVFLTTNGMVAAPELVPAHVQAGLQRQAAAWGGAVPDVAVVAVLTVAAALVWWLARRRPRHAQADESVDP
ncbi:cytochrome c biogenesis CcdA family protein [Actinotalea subterranea]|uniref:cytochrome c biogenesis CcdA family protein n=1 Tax=Actinotalea subterranea TaxID=2607497 RepID=UPI0011EECCD8|nr:cytochrome c biogenesis CcdA family protein [Actinotalea subterranea]